MRIVAACLCFLLGCAGTGQERLRAYADEGRQLFRQGAYAEARDNYQTALTLSPNDPELQFQLARCHEKLGQTAEAEKLYLGCLRNQPSHAEAGLALVGLQLQTGRRREAETFVSNWLRQFPRAAGPYLADGTLRARDGDLDSARARFHQALDFEPRNPRAMTELAVIYEKLDRPDRALVLYERSLEADAEQPKVRKHVEAMLARGITRPRPD